MNDHGAKGDGVTDDTKVCYSKTRIEEMFKTCFLIARASYCLFFFFKLFLFVLIVVSVYLIMWLMSVEEAQLLELDVDMINEENPCGRNCFGG